jgi:hypothetical protein
LSLAHWPRASLTLTNKSGPFVEISLIKGINPFSSYSNQAKAVLISKLICRKILTRSSNSVSAAIHFPLLVVMMLRKIGLLL